MDTSYSVHELAQLSGVSVRTLHHYDRIGLLIPRRQDNGYRRYVAADVRRLQQILLYRTCGLELSSIRRLLDSQDDEQAILADQLQRLKTQRVQLDKTILTVERTLEHVREGAPMTDHDRFEGLKRKAIEDNEKTYGPKARERHGDEAVDKANAALLAMDETTWNDMNALEERIKELLRMAMETGDVSGPAAQDLVDAHARWLQLHWGAGAYTPEIHRSLADGYLASADFTAYYDGSCGAGATKFLRDAIHALA